MFNFVVVLKEPGLNFTLGFKEEGMARAERDKIKDARKEGTTTWVTIVDDYGHRLDAEISNIAAILIQDQQGCMERNNDQNVDTARANDAFVRRRNEDMELMRLFPSQSNIHPAMGRA
jgi:hypothetical protein